MEFLQAWDKGLFIRVHETYEMFQFYKVVIIQNNSKISLRL
jgi:hypothetical protein